MNELQIFKNRGSSTMKNKEFYLDELIDLFSKHFNVGIRNGVPIPCDDIDFCSECEWKGHNNCCSPEKFKEWANEEYVKPKVDWEKVPVDTPVYVWNSEHAERARHFAKVEKGIIYTWINGLTSFTSNKDQVESWDYAELAKPHPEWTIK